MEAASRTTLTGEPARIEGVPGGASGDRFDDGELVGGFRIVRPLGAGGMGVVYEAVDVALNRRVAIKTAQHARDAEALRKEARALAALRHPGIVSVHAMGEHRGIAYVVMERLYGCNLETHLDYRRRGSSPVSLGEAIEVLAPLADVLATVHHAGLAHLDVKPSNVMLVPGGRVVLLDFGVFRAQTDARAPYAVGTPEYMAPEVVTTSVEPRLAYLADEYALGVTAFEMLAGAPPFAGTGEEILQYQVAATAPSLASFRDDLPPAMVALVGELLAKDPRARPASADSVAFRLRRLRARERADAAPFTVLIVEDDDAIAMLLDRHVRRADPGAHVMRVRDIVEAVVLLGTRAPHLLLVDLHMPRMTALDLCAYLRGTELADRSTLVALSAAVSDEDRALVAQLGVTRFIDGAGAELAEGIGEHVREAARGFRRSSYPPDRPLPPRPHARSTPVPRATLPPTSQDPMEIVLESVGDGVVITDANGNPSRWNVAAERILGTALLRPEGTRWIERPGVYSQDGARELPLGERPFARALAGENVDQQEIAMLRPEGGDPFYVSCTARPLRGPKGEVVGGLTVFRETTARRRAEEQLRERERQYRMVARHLPSTSIFLYDRSLRILLAEGGTFTLAGYSQGGLEGRKVDRVLTPEVAREVVPFYEAALRGEEPVRDSEAHGRSYRTRFVPVRDESGAIVGGLAVAEDVTDAKRAQALREELLSARALQDRLVAIGTLASGMGHELNNPLAIVGLSLEAAELALAARDHADVLVCIRDAREGAKRAAGLVRHLHALAPAGVDSPALPVFLDDVARAALRMFQPPPGVSVAEDLPRIDPVLGDGGQLTFAVGCLLDNAAKACARAGVSHGTIRLRTREDRGDAVLEVSDDGCGMAPDVLARAFDPFFTTRGVAGMGLGLSMARAIARASGGSLDVESAPGRGAIFRLRVRHDQLDARSSRPPLPLENSALD